jgi:lysophospholipase L1-like esterase
LTATWPPINSWIISVETSLPNWKCWLFRRQTREEDSVTRILAAIAIFAVLFRPGFAQSPDPKRWEGTIANFEKQDQKSPPPKNAIVFTGSSSIALWKELAQAFPEFPVINRGFGGSTTPDVNFFVDRIVVSYRPQIVVLYSGSNDIAAKRTPEQVLADFQTFVKKVHASLSEAKVLYVSIHTPPGRVKLVETNRRTNKLIAEECTKTPKLTFVDIHDLMLTKDGQPNLDLYRDSLHPNAKGYELWKARLTPLLRKEYRSR